MAALSFSHQNTFTNCQGSRLQAHVSVIMPEQMLPKRIGIVQIARVGRPSIVQTAAGLYSVAGAGATEPSLAGMFMLVHDLRRFFLGGSIDSMARLRWLLLNMAWRATK